MNDVKVTFKNYKALKDGEYNLTNGSVFIMQGPNNVGKTTFLNLLQSIMEVKDNSVNPVTFGEKEGYATGTIIGADGNPYQFRYDFNVDGKRKFQFIDKDNKVIKSINEMRAIFNYTHFTATEFFDWSKTVPGRKKQRDIFLMLLSDKEREDINQIDSKVDPINGTLVETRKELNKEVDIIQKQINSIIISPEEQSLYKQSKSIEELLLSLTERRSAIEATILSSKGISEQIEALNKSHDDKMVLIDESIKNSKDTIKSIEEEIKRLQKSLEDNKVSLDNSIKKRESYIAEYDTKMADLSKKADIEKLEALKKEKIELDDRISKGEAKTKELVAIGLKVKQLETNKELYDKKKKEAEQADENIKILRERKKEIIFSSPNVPAGWALDDDSITIDNIPFLETDLSLSKATKAIVHLMTKVNKSPLMLLGDAESLGYPILNELNRWAAENNKIMVFAEHNRDVQDIQLVCYDEVDNDNNTQELF